MSTKTFDRLSTERMDATRRLKWFNGFRGISPGNYTVMVNSLLQYCQGFGLNVGCAGANVTSINLDRRGKGEIGGSRGLQVWPQIVADALHLPFRGEVFDHVVSMHLLEHLTDAKQGVKEQLRVLRRMGVWGAVLPDPRWHKPDKWHRRMWTHHGFLRWLTVNFPNLKIIDTWQLRQGWKGPFTLHAYSVVAQKLAG